MKNGANASEGSLKFLSKLWFYYVRYVPIVQPYNLKLWNISNLINIQTMRLNDCEKSANK